VARTSNVCEPLARLEYAFGEVHAPHEPASSRHWNVEPLSLDVNVKLAELDVSVPDGPPEIVVSGAVVSGGGTFTVHVRLAGEASVLPAASVARTSNVCDPFARFEYAFGDVQAAQAPASMRHWKVEPLSVDVNEKLAELLVDVPDGPPVMFVSGAVVSGGGGGTSTVQVRLAGEPSVLPAASRARTSNVCDPFARLL
jgi:hypothetical protein